MTLVRSERLLKRRVEDYLWRDKSKTIAALRHVLTNEFGDFDKVSIFGGMIRDLARNGKRGFRSDVDIVVDAPADQVRELAIKLAAKPNKFGGFGYKSTRWEIDFWALETTWAHRHGHIRASNIDDLLEGTFFDWDSVHYDFKSRKLTAQEGYLDRIRSRTLGVNLMCTPSTIGNAARAVRRLLLWDLRPSSLLIEFLEHALAKEGLEAIVAHEVRKYGQSVCISYSSQGELLDALATGNADIRRADGSPRQLELPGLLS